MATNATTKRMAASATALAMDDITPSAVPTLKVMRLQAPQLRQTGLQLSLSCELTSTLLLPDSFGVIHIGETFSAYLGVLNPSAEFSVRGLTVSSQLQTPTRRIVLPSRLDNSLCDIDPKGGVDAIVSRILDEEGQHILRVEVGYISSGSKSLRKFYRFNVTRPLRITETVMPGGDATCLVSINVENVQEKQPLGAGALTIDSVRFEAATGLLAEEIRCHDNPDPEKPRTALQLFDACARLEPGEEYRYLFRVSAESKAIACYDDLGQAVLTYYKAMGDEGVVRSDVVVCPPTLFNHQEINKDMPKFVVHRSGLSVDVDSAAAQRASSGQSNGDGNLDKLLPVTVEPIDPPSSMTLSVPSQVSLLIVNQSKHIMNLQLQLRLSEMTGVVVCGASFISLGEVPPSGGSCTIDVRLVALVAGLFTVQGCYIVDLLTGMEIPQPALFDIFVQGHEDVKEKK